VRETLGRAFGHTNHSPTPHLCSADSYEFESFTLDFLASLTDAERAALPADAAERERLLWTFPKQTLELTWNRGSDKALHHGNSDPGRGFGHVAVSVPDVYAFCAELEGKGVKFQKKPDEGRMKGLAFALTPTGYWVEIISRPADALPTYAGRPALAQTMLRVKDPKPSLDFYSRLLGMQLLREAHFDASRGDFSLYFLGDASTEAGFPDPASDEARVWMVTRDMAVLELTHNHGTEAPDSTYRYCDGNGAEYPLRGFGHIGFLVPDLDAFCAHLETQVPADRWVKRPAEGRMRGIAFVRDPDGYWVEIIQRGVKF
jgi:lactoylglutathione lyase